MVSTEDILKKYEKKIEAEINTEPASYSKEYIKFKSEMLPEISRYERWAKTLGNLIKLKVAERDRVKIQKQLDIAQLDISPSEALTLALLSMLVIFFGMIILLVGVGLAGWLAFSGIVTLGFLGILTSLFVFYYVYGMPSRLANEWRLKASSQMVPAILYIVVYMKHTSNLERAVAFAAEHLEGPLAFDFKKVFYNVEVDKFSTIKESLDNYLENWRDYAPEFIESMHLIESSLYEPSESRRVQILEKSLQVILDGVYEKMLKYSREIRSPLTNIYMLGIVLPTLALALLPLASTLLGNIIRWPHVFIIFNIIVPFLVFYLTSEILLKRPGGYGESSVLELSPDYEKFKSRKHWLVASLISFPIFLLGLLPFIAYYIFGSDATFGELGFSFFADTKIFDFKTISSAAGTSTVGPFGPLAILLSLLIPLSIGLFFSLAYSGKTKELINSREKTKVLEEEFTNSLFQLGNRLGDGTPAEIAFGRVAETTSGQETSRFFATVNRNIQGAGMSVEKAIFDKKRGAITYFPSPLVATSMKILVESVKKGLKAAASSIMAISDYVKNIQKINARLHDLLAEVVSDMKSNMTFLAPLLAGIVVGLSSMITMILNKLQTLQATGGAEAVAGFGNLANITQIFDVTQMIPPYFLQIIVGLYIVEIIFILTSALVTVDSGRDVLKEKYELGRNLRTGILLYTLTALISILALTLLAGVALGGMG
jgi:MFS family permease